MTTQYFNHQKETDMKRKKNGYRAFLKKSGFKAREGKQVSISKETHDKVAMIVRLLGDGEVTIADFTENVVSEFLRTHRDELNRMLNALPKVEL
ncbi:MULTISPECIES: DUF3408 domain-containing protein [Parabacteroides]|uniref:DUF3408 domain-containing protein n=1 Tax=Parabacteroides TaxID=375288 RepID=UPI00257D36C5|nr:DUF3408 domain-containing protein [Parabacteroides sp.]